MTCYPLHQPLRVIDEKVAKNINSTAYKPRNEVIEHFVKQNFKDNQ